MIELILENDMIEASTEIISKFTFADGSERIVNIQIGTIGVVCLINENGIFLVEFLDINQNSLDIHGVTRDKIKLIPKCKLGNLFPHGPTGAGLSY